MSAINRSVSDALERAAEQRHEGALRDICGAIEGTLKKHGAGGKANYKSWLRRNLDTILEFSLPGVETTDLRIAYTHLELPITNPEGIPSIEDIVYHVVRCELYHVGGLPDDIAFTDGILGGGGGGLDLQIPSDIVLGLIIAVVTCVENRGEELDSDLTLFVNGTPLSLNRFWGLKQQMIDAIRYTKLAAGHFRTTRLDWQLAKAVR